MHEVSLPRAFDLKLLKNILKALQKLVSISLQSLKIDSFYQNILSETLKTGWLTPSDSDRAVCFPTLGAESLDSPARVLRGAAVTSIPWWLQDGEQRKWPGLSEALGGYINNTPVKGMNACWEPATRQALTWASRLLNLWNLHNSPVRSFYRTRRFRDVCDLLKVIEWN